MPGRGRLQGRVLVQRWPRELHSHILGVVQVGVVRGGGAARQDPGRHRVRALRAVWRLSSAACGQHQRGSALRRTCSSAPISHFSTPCVCARRYGEIGQEVARLARAYGIRVVALRRRTQLTADEVKEGLVEKVYSPDQVKELAAESDYVLISTPWTPATDKVRSRRVMLCLGRPGRHAQSETHCPPPCCAQILSKEAIAVLKPNAVVINVGRGKCIDEEALIDGACSSYLHAAQSWSSLPTITPSGAPPPYPRDVQRCGRSASAAPRST